MLGDGLVDGIELADGDGLTDGDGLADGIGLADGDRLASDNGEGSSAGLSSDEDSGFVFDVICVAFSSNSTFAGIDGISALRSVSVFEFIDVRLLDCSGVAPVKSMDAEQFTNNNDKIQTV